MSPSYFLTALVIALGCADLLACDLDASIENFLLENQPPDAGRGNIVDQHTGIHRGTLHSTAVLFSYEMIKNRNRSDQQLVLFENCTASQAVAIGRRGLQYFDSVNVEQGKIVVSGMKWESDDSMCCPSTKADLLFVYNGTGMPVVLAGPT